MRAVVLTLFMLVSPLLMAAELRDLRLWEGPDATRVVFDLKGAAGHKVFTLANPDRVVIDIAGLSADSVKAAQRAESKGVVRKVRAAPREDGSVRIVLDVSSTVIAKSFALDPNEEYGHRLVLDLFTGAKPAAPPTIAAVIAAAPKPQDAPPAVEASPEIRFQDKPIVIAIDAGHGGEDPGARGRSGLLEKDVALKLSRKLAALINAQPGMKAVLTRDGDYYVGLRSRVGKAREAQADLFVSVHANAFKDREMRGTAVYALSTRGATSEQARWLAHKENSADMVGGIEIGGKDEDLAKVLIDISQDATMEASLDVGGRILKRMGQINKLQKRSVQQAGFAVLKAPDIPSVLIETAFITNADEERMLRDGESQDKLADAMLEGIKGYFKTYRPQQQVVEQDPRLIQVRADAAAQDGRLFALGGAVTEASDRSRQVQAP